MAINRLKNIEFGVQEIDTRHGEFLRAYDAAFNKSGHGNELEGLAELTGFLDNYAQSQFKYEELLISKSHYEDGGVHLDEHRLFVSGLESFKAQLSREGPTKELFFSLKGTLIRWMIFHIGRTDQIFCDFLFNCKGSNDANFIDRKLGDILIEDGVISRTTLEKALERQQDSEKKLGEVLEQMGKAGTDQISSALLTQEKGRQLAKKLGSILVESGFISQDTLDRALELQKESGKMLGALLVDMGVISTEEIIEAQAVQKGILKAKPV